METKKFNNRREFIISSGKILGTAAVAGAIPINSFLHSKDAREEASVFLLEDKGYIDVHVHTRLPSRINLPGTEASRLPTPLELLVKMVESGISKAVLLPLVSPECRDFFVTSEETLEICSQFPDRLIPFCNLDPRFISNSTKANFIPLLTAYKDAGCKGVGEYCPNIPLDDPLNINLFKQIEEAGLHLLFHLAPQVGGYYGCYDDVGLPRLENVLKQCPKLIILGHSQVFWAEIGPINNPAERGGYPKGPILKEGRLVALMRKYPNLYGDISAGSGFNAISRDPEFGYRFMEEFQDQLCFGSDYCHVIQDIPQVPYFKKLKDEKLIPDSVYEKIAWKNAARLLL